MAAAAFFDDTRQRQLAAVQTAFLRAPRVASLPPLHPCQLPVTGTNNNNNINTNTGSVHRRGKATKKNPIRFLHFWPPGTTRHILLSVARSAARPTRTFRTKTGRGHPPRVFSRFSLGFNTRFVDGVKAHIILGLEYFSSRTPNSGHQWSNGTVCVVVAIGRVRRGS